MNTVSLDRRTFLKLGATAFSVVAGPRLATIRGAKGPALKPRTGFQIACMTRPYAAFPFERA